MRCTTTVSDGNPFDVSSFYVNPSYRHELQVSIDTASGTTKSTLEQMVEVPSAYWIDVKSKVRVLEVIRCSSRVANGRVAFWARAYDCGQHAHGARKDRDVHVKPAPTHPALPGHRQRHKQCRGNSHGCR